ncbi:MAG TPA: ATP-binding protein [Thermomicrobiales bacterium]
MRPRRRLPQSLSQPLIGAGVVLLPAVILAPFGSSLSVSTPGIVLLVAVAFATYLADLAGGVVSLLTALVALNLFFVGDRLRMSAPQSLSEAFGYGATLVCGTLMIALIERVKQQGLEDRRAAIVARSTASVLAALRAAAADPPGDEAGRRRVFDGALRAMIGVQRAHAGALFLADDVTGTLTQVATYGFRPRSNGSDRLPSLEESLAGLVAREFRALSIDDLIRSGRFDRAALRDSSVRSAVGVPIFGRDGRLVGVSVIGLLPRHRFSSVEIAKLEALAGQIAPIIEAMSASAERESQLQRALAEQRRLSLVLTALPEAVVLAAPPDGRIIAANDAATTLFGPLREADLSGRLLAADGSECGKEDLPIAAALRTGEVVVGVELIAVGPEGTQTPVLGSAAPIREPDGEIAAVVAVFRNIAALKAAARVKEEFISVVSHELRSPLTPIRGFVQLVARDLAREGGHESQVKRLNAIAGHVDRMTRLVDDLLDVSRLRAGGLEIRRAPTDLVQICRDVVQSRAAAAPDHHVRLITSEQAIVGDWDADRLHQIVDNLVANAVKYTPVGGHVTVHVCLESRGREAICQVIDDGPGIAPEDRERIFAAFYRTSEATLGGQGGLGLGLYICHELVAAHGGRVEVGEAPGGGAVFTVHLPLSRQALAA